VTLLGSILFRADEVIEMPTAAGEYKWANLKSSLDLNISPNSPDFVIYALYFTGEFVNCLNEIFDDVVLRALLLRLAKKSFCP
jgi:hypothetical protein